MENRWNASIQGEQVARVYVPAAWVGQSVLLRSPEWESWTTVQLAGQSLSRDAEHGEWLVSAQLTYGEWNPLVVTGGPLTGAYLVARPALYISQLSATKTGERLLRVRVTLSAHQPAEFFLTLTARDGLRVGVQSAKTEGASELMTEMGLPQMAPGTYRLKVVLHRGDQVLDNARISLCI